MENYQPYIYASPSDCSNFDKTKEVNMGIYYYDAGQHFFDNVLSALWIAAKWLAKAVVYLPLWFCGYLLSATMLTPKDSAVAWIGLVVLIAVVMYQLLFFIKGILIALKAYQKLVWIFLFLVCCTFTCILPAWFIYHAIQPLMTELSAQSASTLTWIAAITSGVLVYSQYHFLTNIAPRAAYPVYQLGIDSALKLMKVYSELKAKKSRQLV